MNVSNFVEEFTQLILRWKNPPAPNDQNVVNPILPLTNQQILTSVEDVLRVILEKNVQITDYSSVTTPATGIAVCTPNAPVISKLEVESKGSLSRYRSLDALTTNISRSQNAHFSNASTTKSQEKMEIVDNNTLDCPSEEKRCISRSSPAINVSCVNRSNTFVRDGEESETTNNKSKDEEDDVFAKFEYAFSTNTDKIKSDILPVLEELRKAAFGMMCKIDDTKKKFYPQTTKPIRRLSSIGGNGLPGLTRSTTMMRPIPPPKIRRSVSSGFPGTPTSSKPNSTFTEDKEGSAASRKTLTPGICYSKSSSCSSNNSVSSFTKKSPLFCSRPAKNPKYAHVQSTIPKPLANKRKAQ